jgi:aminoglycoside phosphotransferase (APT) family kinase protein
VRWADLDPLLRRYAAPPLRERLTVAGRTALVFPVLPAVDRRVAPDEVLGVLARLHADRGLAGALGPPVPARASYTSVWLDRFRADLEVVDGYVASDALVWMTDEVEAFAGLLAGPVFDEPVHAAIHGDPWHENVLAGPDRWWLLDWEDLAVGDPAVDESIVAPGRHDSARHRVGHRAVMLDAVVDGAADWVENHDPVVRAAKEVSYLRAIEEYERVWG